MLGWMEYRNLDFGFELLSNMKTYIPPLVRFNASRVDIGHHNILYIQMHYYQYVVISFSFIFIYVYNKLTKFHISFGFYIIKFIYNKILSIKNYNYIYVA
jgi:hypothetical protein